MDLRLLTPRGAGGVAVLALYGSERLAEAQECFGLRLAPGQGPRLAVLRVDGEDLDQVLCLDRPAAHCLELHTHASPALLARLESRFGALAAPRPDPAESLLRRARSAGQLALAVEQSAFDLEVEVRRLAALPQAAAEAGFRALRERSRRARALAEPERLLLIGPQNAGKSTLMNRLLFQERALTGALPGLTRDPVREEVLLAGYPYELIDTAGIGPVQDELDAAAQQLGRSLWAQATRILVLDGSSALPPGIDELLAEADLVLRSKQDLPATAWGRELPVDLHVSCVSAAGAGDLQRRVGECLRGRRELPRPGPVGGPAALDAAGVAAVTGLWETLLGDGT